MLVIAHRTCPKDAPENSLEGIRVAAEQGADGVEVDLQLSIDGRAYLMHDRTLRRTVGPPWPLVLMPSFILSRLRVQERGRPIPTLAEAFDALPDGMLLAVDVKTPWAVAALLKETRRRRMEARVLVWCESARAARWTSRRAPEIEVAYLKTALDPPAQLLFLNTAIAAGARAVSAHWLAVDAGFVSAAHARGLKVYSWHGEYDLTEEKLRCGLDALITDYPAAAREAMAKAGA